MPKDPDFCQICKRDPLAVVRTYSKEPFVDGRNYDLICWTCANVPKSFEMVDGQPVVLYGLDPAKINDVEGMIADGWSKVEAEVSIKAVKRLLKNALAIVEPAGGANVFAELFIDVEIHGKT
jgi:hypothetical protein